MPGEVITTLKNEQYPSAGDPPAFDADEYDYVSYFENQNDDQFVFVYDGDEKTVTVHVSNHSWENPITVDRQYLRRPADALGVVMDHVILEDYEQQWMIACFEAVRFRA